MQNYKTIQNRIESLENDLQLAVDIYNGDKSRYDIISKKIDDLDKIAKETIDLFMKRNSITSWVKADNILMGLR